MLYKNDDSVFIANGLARGDRIILTNVAAAMEGMPLLLNGPSGRPGNERICGRTGRWRTAILKRQGAIAWMAGNSVAANLAMLFLLVGGLFWGTHIKQEVFPEFTLDEVVVSVAYPGASPAEVEEGILLPVEEAIGSVDGIKEVTSKANEGSGTDAGHATTAGT